jgi:hypothetical protein
VATQAEAAAAQPKAEPKEEDLSGSGAGRGRGRGRHSKPAAGVLGRSGGRGFTRHPRRPEGMCIGCHYRQIGVLEGAHTKKVGECTLAVKQEAGSGSD